MGRVATLSRFSRVRSPAPRKTSWEIGPGGTGATAFSTPSTAILGSGGTPVSDGFTIVRLHGYMEVVLEAVSAIGGGFIGALGIGIVTADAFAIGQTAMPQPITDINWRGWLAYQFFSLHSTTATIADGGNTNRISFDIDSKAMRKFPLNETIFASVQVFEVISSQIEVFFHSRILVKLS